ncbi:MAG: NAD-binding protein [Pseudomonadota bacterium]
MPVGSPSQQQFPWRTVGALFFFLSAILGFEMGVAVTERPEIVEADLLTKAYYSLSLFVVGGVDLGTPYGGTFLGRALVWTAYFGAPILAASTLILALLRALSPQRWVLRRLEDHIVLVGAGELTISALKILRQRNGRIPVVVACKTQEPLLQAELKDKFDALVVIGDIAHDYFLEQLRLDKARKIFLLGEDSLRSYEVATSLLSRYPGIAGKIVIHCAKLRFMRAMQNTTVAQRCDVFNTYHLAATALVRDHMLDRFRDSKAKDIVVLAGFGRFGQTILEQLQTQAPDEMETVIIIDSDAYRRVLVADEQMRFSGNYRRELLEGDISHPDVWNKVRSTADIGSSNTVFVLGTGGEEENLRTSLWLRRKYPEAMVIARSRRESLFSNEVGQEHNIICVSITKLVEDNLPRTWTDPG